MSDQQRLSPILVALLCASSLTACQGLALVGGKGTSNGSPPRASGGGGGKRIASGVPDVAPLESGRAPPWCGDGYQKSINDSNVGWAKSELEQSGGMTLKGLRYMARAACDKPGDGKRGEQVQAWKADFIARYQATEKDFVLAMTLAVEDKTSTALREEQCKRFKSLDDEPSAEKRAQIRAESFAVGCLDEIPDSDLYWLDVDGVTMIQRMVVVDGCLPRHDGKEERPRGELAFCGRDLLGLDRAKLDQEASALDLNMYGRVMLTMSFGTLKTRGEAVMKRIAELAKKDSSYQKLLDAHEAGWKAWKKAYKANAEVFKAVAEFDTKVNQGSKKAVAGCGTDLRKLFFERLRGAKIKSREDAIALATDLVGYPLLVAMIRCDAMEERYFEAASAHSVYFTKALKAYRGPRHAAYYATLEALNDIRADRESFKLDRLLPQPGGEGQKLAYKAYEMTFNKIDYGSAQGKVKGVTRSGDEAKVTFQTVRWKEPTFKCRTTNRIARITEDGTLQYEEICKVTGYTNQSSTESPVVVPKDFAVGLKRGQMVVMSLNTKHNKRVAIPVEVYADEKKKQFSGFFGLAWR